MTWWTDWNASDFVRNDWLNDKEIWYCWEAEKNLKTTPGSDCALNALAIDEPLEYVRLYLDGNMQMWVDAEDSLEIF